MAKSKVSIRLATTEQVQISQVWSIWYTGSVENVEKTVGMKKMETSSMMMMRCVSSWRKATLKRKWGLGGSCKWNFLCISLVTEFA